VALNGKKPGKGDKRSVIRRHNFDFQRSVREFGPPYETVETRSLCTNEFTTVEAMAITRILTGGTLATLAALHTVWGLGSPFPFHTRGELADAVVGTASFPSASPCFGVAALLALASGMVTRVIPLPQTIRRSGLTVLSLVFTLRSLAGFLGHTSLLSPGSHSERFLRLDRRYFSPICLCLAVGAWTTRK
jgi:hypothetical protein